MKIKWMFLCSIFLFAGGYFICPVYAAKTKEKANKVKFSQSLSEKMFKEEGEWTEPVPGWTWSFSGKIYGDFSEDLYFDGTTSLEILIGNFSTSTYFETLSEIEEYIKGEDLDGNDPEKKLRGKYNVDRIKKKGSIKYNWVASWDKDLPNGDTKTMYKKSGSITLKWDEKSFSFNIKVTISPTDYYFKDINTPELPLAIEDISPPENDPAPGKPYTLKKNNTGSVLCLFRFGNFVVSKRGFSYTVKRKLQRILKGREKDEEYFLDSHSLKENKATAILVPPPPPIAVADSIEINYGTPTDIDVLANDTNYIEGFIETDQGILISEIKENPNHGTVNIIEDGTYIEYIPNDKFIGKDEFTYIAKDIMGRETKPAKVIIYVASNDKNNQPFAVDDTASTEIDKPVGIDVLANDVDIDKSDILNVYVSIPENGEAEIIEDPNNKNKTIIKYTPAPGYVSEEDTPDYFEYAISDGHGGYSTASVYVYVGIANNNNDPQAESDAFFSAVNQEATLDVLANDQDPDNDPLSIAALLEQPKHGKVQTDGNFIYYTPQINFSGTEIIKYRITDGRGGYSDSEVAVVVNIPPVAYDDVAETNISTKVEINVLDNDKAGSVSEDKLFVSVANSKPINGTVNTDGNSIIYNPNEGFSGIDIFEYTISDGQEGYSTAKVTVFVGEKNNNMPPTANDDQLYAIKNEEVELKILANDSDSDDDKIRIMDILENPKYGRITYTDNSLFYLSEAPSSDENDPDYDPNYKKLDSFKYLISDSRGGTAEATVNLTINTAPYAVMDKFETNSNTPLSISLNNLLSNDYDEEGDSLSITAIASSPAHGTAILSGNTITYTPNDGYTGADSFNYQLEDDKGAKSTGEINIVIK